MVKEGDLSLCVYQPGTGFVFAIRYDLLRFICRPASCFADGAHPLLPLSGANDQLKSHKASSLATSSW